ncbi:MAG: helix-turn-helix domain-containing protein [Firmicutes bacterium]|nr:helix-turn-helix domain-containing protein [Bacillota bacterium]
MAQKKLADLLKEARAKSKLSQTALANLVDGMSASDIGKAERGELVPTQAQLRQIAKACGVTQASLIEASKAASGKSASSSKKTASSGKTASSSSKKTSSGSKKTGSSSQTSKKASDEYKLTAAEKNLIDLYRKADSDTKKASIKLLKGEKSEISEMLTSMLGKTVQNLMKK